MSSNEQSSSLCRQAVDGVILVGDDFGFLRKVGIKMDNVYAAKVEPSALKGVEGLLPSFDHYRVTISQKTLAVGLIISVSGTLRVSLSACELKRLTKESFCSAIQEMPESKTWKRRLCDGWSDFVYAEDQDEILDKMIQSLEYKLGCTGSAGDCVSLKPIAFRMGMDADWQVLPTFLDCFYPERAEQVIVHYAQDFVLEDHLLAWAKHAADSLFPHGKVTGKYGVGLIKDAFGYYTKFEQETSTPYSRFKLDSIKMYSELFKNVHRGNFLPFNVPKISLELFSPKQFEWGKRGPSKDWNQIEQQIQMAIQTVQDIMQLSSVTARIEAVVSVQDLQNCGPRETLQILKQVPKFVTEAFGSVNVLKKNLRAFPMEKVQEYFRGNVLPFAHTLEMMVAHRKFCNVSRKGAIWDGTGPEEFYTALACENALRLAFYGTDFRDGRCFPLIVRNVLGLTQRQTTLRTGPLFPDWIFGKRIQRKLIGSEKLVAVAPIPSQIGELVLHELYMYFGKTNQRRPEWANNLLKVLDTVRHYAPGCLEEEIKQELESVAEDLFNFLLKSCLQFRKRYKYKTNTLHAIQVRNWEWRDKSRVKFVSSFDLAKNICARDETMWRHVFLCWFTNVTYFVLREFEELQEHLIFLIAAKIEEAMFQQGHLLVVPVDGKSIFCVVPFAGTAGCSYITMNDVQQKALLKDCSEKLKGFFPSEMSGDNFHENVSTDVYDMALENFAEKRFPLSTKLSAFKRELRRCFEML